MIKVELKKETYCLFEDDRLLYETIYPTVVQMIIERPLYKMMFEKSGKLDVMFLELKDLTVLGGYDRVIIYPVTSDLNKDDWHYTYGGLFWTIWLDKTEVCRAYTKAAMLKLSGSDLYEYADGNEKVILNYDQVIARIKDSKGRIEIWRCT